MARIFPEKDVDIKAATTARLTIQLQSIPFVKAARRPAVPCDA